MRLDKKLADVLNTITSSRTENNTLSWEEVPALIDLTLLDKEATPQKIEALALKAQQNQVAAICVLPHHLSYISPEINIKRATVVNFPSGNESQHQILNTIEQTIALQQVDEIDYVFPYQAYLAGESKFALSSCHEAFLLCKQNELVFKVILETGALPSPEAIYELSIAVLNVGCDFLKTSTGKIAQGATIPAVFSMLSAIVDSNIPCGIKVSGGIKTIEQAFSYIQLAQYMFNRKVDNTCFRLGASSLLDDLLNQQSSPH